MACEAMATTAIAVAMLVTTDQARFRSHLDAVARDIETLLERLLAAAAPPGDVARPPRLVEAMRYASLGGGKRLRPFLVVETATLFAVPRERALMVGAALECIHNYSLIHDDLPAMDDDVMRRGRATLHKAFDEATAILAGDALLTLAFELLARPDTHPDPAVRIALVGALARAAGFSGMAGGQMLDLIAEGRFSRAHALSEDEIMALQAMKTGALIRFACLAGAILGGASAPERAALELYGAALGQAFQLADDLLDVEGDSATLGKSIGKDAAHGKATLVTALGTAGAHARLKTLIARAETALAPLGNRASMLKAAARFVAARRT
jgi:farnesyl diphosphate synthase